MQDGVSHDLCLRIEGGAITPITMFGDRRLNNCEIKKRKVEVRLGRDLCIASKAPALRSRHARVRHPTPTYCKNMGIIYTFLACSRA